MARTAEEIIKAQLGNLVFQLALVQNQLEDALEKNAVLEKEAEVSKKSQKSPKEDVSK